MKLISNRTWQIESETDIPQIKGWLINIGGKEDENLTNPYEKWRIRFLDATITFYASPKKMTLFITDSDYEEILKVHKYIDSILGSKFVLPSKEFLIGLDETGKGEVLGHVILVGVMFPKGLFNELDRFCGVANTKTKRTTAYWDEVFNKIDFYRSKGLEFFIEKIPPWHFDKYNINQLMDLTYQRILLYFAQKLELQKCRIVIDDYGVGLRLKNFLNFLSQSGSEVILTSKADDKYLESRIASLIAKRMQQKVLEAISNSHEFKIKNKELGSGNAGDLKTLDWLSTWWAIHKKWPWFVKQSFKTIAEIEGRQAFKKYKVPPLNENLLSEEFRKKFNSGKLDIRSLSVVCPSCGQIGKSIKLIPKEGRTTAICVSCSEEIIGTAITLRYYCGRILPDNSIITRGFLSKDLESAKFFENFTILLHPIVKKESDHPGGKKELERLGHFHTIGRIRLEESAPLIKYEDLESVVRDDAIQEGALEHNAILMTADNGMKGSAQAKGLFVFEV